MKRSEYLQELAEELAKEFHSRIAREKLLKDGEVAEISISAKIKLVPVPILCKIDDYDKEALVATTTPEASEIPLSPSPLPTEVKKELATLNLQKPADDNTALPINDPLVDYLAPFIVTPGHQAVGKFCQVCTEKIKVGEQIRERGRISLLNPANIDPNLKFYEHAKECFSSENASGFGQGTGGGKQIIKSGRHLGG